MRLLILILLITFLSTFSCLAAFEPKLGSARTAALGDSFTGLADGGEAIFFNPAGLSQIKSPQISTFYTRLFSISELNYSSLILSQPITDRGNLSIAYNQFGYSLYREKEFIFNAAANWREKIFFGSNLRQSQLILGKDWGKASVWRNDIGFLLKVSSRLRWGTMVSNLNQPHLGAEAIPLSWRTGLSYFWSPAFLSLLDYSKTSGSKSRLHWGQELILLPFLVLRFGIENNPTRLSLGGGLNIGKVNLDYAFVEHQLFSPEHHFSLRFRWK